MRRYKRIEEPYINYTEKYHQLKEYFKEILEFRGFKIYDTLHSVDRYIKRVGRKMFLYEKLLKMGINYLIENNLTKVENKWVFVSNKYEFRIQVHWRQGEKGSDAGKWGGYSASTLTKNEKYNIQGDKEIALESEIDEFKAIYLDI